MGVTPAQPVGAEAARWHDLECGSYRVDLDLWRELADGADGPILDVGAGTGRVALELARMGYEVVALDVDHRLLHALEERAAGLAVQTVCADARDFALRRRFSLIVVPMQTIQLLGGAEGRAQMLGCAGVHLLGGATLAVAIASRLEPFDATVDEPPVPDVGEHDGTLYASCPVAVRAQADRFVLERRRETIAVDGARTELLDVVTLARLEAGQLEAEARALGYEVRGRRHIPPTAEHVGSEVVVLGG